MSELTTKEMVDQIDVIMRLQPTRTGIPRDARVVYLDVLREWGERLKLIESIDFARLRELAEAEREGRVVVLPCKVGDVVFVDTEGFMGIQLPHMPMEVKSIVAELYGDWGDCKQKQYASLEELSALAEPKGEATT